MAFEDRYGLPISASNEAAADAYRQGMDSASAGRAPRRPSDWAIETDPDFALAHAARARAHLIYAEMQPAREKAATARQLVARNGTERW